MDQTQAITTLPTPTAMNIRQGVFDDVNKFELAQRIASCLVTSSMVPERYRGKDNLGNVMIALDLAARIGLPPLMVMQHLYVVYGTPGWSGQMVTALINGSKLFKDPLEYEMKGKPGQDDWGCRCYAETQAGKKVYGPWVDIAMAKAEGWYDRKDTNGRYCSKWRTIPEMMLRYRSAAYFGRTVCPDVTIGLRTIDEEEEIVPQGTVIEIAPQQDAPAGTAPTLVATGVTSTGTPTIKAKRARSVPTKPSEPPAKPTPAEPEPEPATQPAATETPKPADPEPPKTEPAKDPEPNNAKPVTVEEMVAIVAEKLQASKLSVDDFFDWISGSGRGQRFKVDVDSITEIGELPPKLLTELVNGDLDICIRAMAPR